MKKYAASIMLILGIAAFSKNENGIFCLSDEQKEALVKANFKAEFVEKFNVALGQNFEEGASATSDGDESQAGLTLVDLQTLQTTTVALANAEQALETANANAGTLAADKLRLEKSVTDLQAKVQTLSNKSEEDAGLGTQHNQGGGMKIFSLDDDKQFGGQEGVMWNLDRPYNQRARAALLAKNGMQLMVPSASSTDFTALEADLGAFYRQNRTEQLFSFVTKTKDVSLIFPLESGIQDREVITNIFLGEFSQADNSSSNFDDVVKGKYEIQAEEIRMYDVMMAHKFTDLKKLEKQWIGYLNREGSSSIKMSFIEYLLAKTVEKLFNEQQQRRIKGVRKNPSVNVPGTAMEASTGCYRFISEKINNLQIKPFVLGEITSANIGDKIFKGTGMIPQDLRDSGSVVLYMSKDMITEYHEYNEMHYGTNQDYKADIMYVKQYPDVQIKAVPNAGNHRRLIWTLDGNLKTFENEPGEMTRFVIKLDMWSVNVTSQWKEGFGGILVGKKWDRVQDMDYNHQFVFCNESDLATDQFLDMEKDTVTPSALFHSSLVSVPNTASKAITNILDVETGAQVRLKCGSDAYGITIAQAGNFSTISAAWNPSAGDTITLVKRADGKFIEMSRATAATTALAFTADDATPSVAGGTEFQIGENTQATAITNLDNAVAGTTYILHGLGSTFASTIANSGNFTLTAAMTLSLGKSITLIALPNGKFAEISRV